MTLMTRLLTDRVRKYILSVLLNTTSDRADIRTDIPALSLVEHT